MAPIYRGGRLYTGDGAYIQGVAFVYIRRFKYIQEVAPVYRGREAYICILLYVNNP